MEKILDSELKELQDYYLKEAEQAAIIGRLNTELFMLQDRIETVQTELQTVKIKYVTDNKNQYNKLQTLLKKYNAKEINTSTGELTK
ncbi:MAG: hypothetical protein WC346_08180 [Methanogenium sp.]|jgi:non-ribosomal peptide synthetase component E (peptide arylation enzyme)